MRLVITLFIYFVFFSSHAAPPASPQKYVNEEIIMLSVGSGNARAELETTIFTPPGEGPFPLAMINHGKATGNPRLHPRDRFLALSGELVKRGYLVAIPMRRGFARSTGAFSGYDACEVFVNAYSQAKEIIQALHVLERRADVDKTRIVLLGQSYGGISSLVVGMQPREGLKGVINFSGGIKLDERKGCLWRPLMVEAFGYIGSKSRLPTLWFYGDNDSLWGEDLPRELFTAYTAAGGKARMVSFGTDPNGDAHGMVHRVQSVEIWLPELERFLQSVRLPWRVIGMDSQTKPAFELSRAVP